jgi:hypothetical protein
MNSKAPLKDRLRATFLSHLPDYVVRENGVEKWVENPTKLFLRDFYDAISGPIRRRRWKVPHFGNDRTAYVIGLFGSGRSYINELILQNFGPRARYLRGRIRLHPTPTSMIYTGHATMKYPSRLQRLPAVTNRILEAVQSGYADLIFVYRHPLDSLLTNWLWWRAYLGEKRYIGSISEIYKTPSELCAALEQDFEEFQAFAEGNPGFFAATRGPRFLSFSEFVEETELFARTSTLSLRLEDFMLDPIREFHRLAEIMSVPVDTTSVVIPRPKAKLYGHLTVQQKVPLFREFVNNLDSETKKRIEKIGYALTPDRDSYPAGTSGVSYCAS